MTSKPGVFLESSYVPCQIPPVRSLVSHGTQESETPSPRQFSPDCRQIGLARAWARKPPGHQFRAHRLHQPKQRIRQGRGHLCRLKDFAVQDEYRAFVQNKVTEYWRRYRRPQGMSEAEAKQRPEVEGNLLIHLRKLREGISSSKRCDGFSLEVYEVSLHLSIIFRSPVQTTSVIPPLLNLYSAAASASIPIQLPSSLASTTLLAQLHHLVVHFPSQRTLFDRTAPLYFTLADDSHLNTWIRSVARSLRRAEYAQLDILTRAPALDRLFAPSSDTPDLRKESLRTLAQDLRACARASAWRVLRNTYREVALAVGDTRSWATRALVLVDAEEKQEGYGEGDGSENEGAVDAWFMERDKLGEIVRKEGAQGRWVMVKVKS